MSNARVNGWLVAVPVDFRIARARIRFSHHVIIQVQMEGVTGIGEGILYRTLAHQVGDSFQRLVIPRLEHCHGVLQTNERGHKAWIRQLGAASPALAYALDTALYDLFAKYHGQQLVHLLGGPRRDLIPITEQVFIRKWSETKKELDAILSRGTRRIKLKIGVNPRADLEMVRRVRAFVGSEVEIQVDANRAYTLGEAYALYWGLAELGVAGLEEPLRDWCRLAELRSRFGIPVILDETILNLADLRRAIAEEAIDILNIKLTRVGGISQALRYAEICREHGIEVALGCSEELGVGTTAIMHLAAALPELHSMEGLGPQRLGFDVIGGEWAIRDGMQALPEGPGLGVTLPQDWASRLPRGVRCFDLGDRSWRLPAFSHWSRWFQRVNNVAWRIWGRRRM